MSKLSAHSVRPRLPENQAVVGKEVVDNFDHQDKSRFFLRLPLVLRLIRYGMGSGTILEAGCGTGILGLNVLKRSRRNAVTLYGVDISSDMTETAHRNARLLGVQHRARFIGADLARLPFPDSFFDGILSNGSLHHWTDPIAVLKELHRVLKPEGTVFINDLRRDVSPTLIILLKAVLNAWQRKYLDISLNAAYTLAECKNILSHSGIKQWQVHQSLMELDIRRIAQHENCDRPSSRTHQRSFPFR